MNQLKRIVHKKSMILVLLFTVFSFPLCDSSDGNDMVSENEVEFSVNMSEHQEYHSLEVDLKNLNPAKSGNFNIRLGYDADTSSDINNIIITEIVDKGGTSSEHTIDLSRIILKYENEIILLTEDSLSSYFKLIIQFPKDQSYYLPLKDLNVVFWDYRGGRGCDHDVADNKFVKSENLDYIIDTR